MFNFVIKKFLIHIRILVIYKIIKLLILYQQKVNDMWEILKYMVTIPAFPTGEDPIKTRQTKPVVEAFVRQGTRYLEDRYKTYMSSVINENLSLAMRGGVPGTYHLVKSFVGVRLQGDYLGLQDGSIDGRPLWPMVYYCLRSGDISAALHCLKQSSCNECQELVAILEMKFNAPSSADFVKLETNVRFQYRRCGNIFFLLFLFLPTYLKN